MTSVCGVCKESFRGAYDVKIFRSSLCGHSCCSQCLCGVGALKANVAFSFEWIVPRIACRVCGVVCGAPSAAATGKVHVTSNGEAIGGEAPVSPASDFSDDDDDGGQWVDTSEEAAGSEREKIVRTRVLSILNAERVDFQNTPLYNDFLEKREQSIYDLAWSADERRKAELNEMLREAEVENQAKILESETRKKVRAGERIRDIVAKEGVFYQLVSESYGDRFIYNRAAPKLDPSKDNTAGAGAGDGRAMGASIMSTGNSSNNDSRFVHPLQLEHPELFADLNALSIDPKSGTFGTRNFAGILNQLMQNLPTRLSVPSGEDLQMALPNKHYTAAVARQARNASGHSKQAVSQRTYSELHRGGIRLTPLSL